MTFILTILMIVIRVAHLMRFDFFVKQLLVFPGFEGISGFSIFILKTWVRSSQVPRPTCELGNLTSVLQHVRCLCCAIAP